MQSEESSGSPRDWHSSVTRPSTSPIHWCIGTVVVIPAASCTAVASFL